MDHVQGTLSPYTRAQSVLSGLTAPRVGPTPSACWGDPWMPVVEEALKFPLHTH